MEKETKIRFQLDVTPEGWTCASSEQVGAVARALWTDGSTRKFGIQLTRRNVSVVVELPTSDLPTINRIQTMRNTLASHVEAAMNGRVEPGEAAMDEGPIRCFR